MSVDFQNAWDLFYRRFVTQGGYKSVLSGLSVTVQIAVFGLLIGIVIGTLIAVVKVMPKYKLWPKILEKVADVYVGFFRGTPLMVQLLIGWFGICTTFDLPITRMTAAILIYGMNSGAYVAEIMRSGIQAVDPGQLEAARALGLGYPISMLKVVIPQAVKNILPTMGNEFITLIKETTLYSAFTRLEKNGFISSRLGGDESGGKRRTYYSITQAGRQYYAEKREEWNLTKEVINLFIKETE